MLRPGDVVITEFAGATAVKRRPAVVISSDLYHHHRPDVVIAVLTTRLSAATTPLDYLLQDWAAAGLHRPSAFRCYLGTCPVDQVQAIGHLSERDWQGVCACLSRALALPRERLP